jgi:hypothetical protein
LKLYLPNAAIPKMTVQIIRGRNDILYKNWLLQLPIDYFFADMDVLTNLLIPQSNFGHDMVIIIVIAFTP